MSDPNPGAVHPAVTNIVPLARASSIGYFQPKNKVDQRALTAAQVLVATSILVTFLFILITTVPSNGSRAVSFG